jgi:hypothetical protein
MNRFYRHGHTPTNHRSKIFVATFVSVFLVLLGGGYLVWRDIRANISQEVVQGESRVVGQVLGNDNAIQLIDEDVFSFELPGDWQLIDQVDSAREKSFEWQATLKNEDNRYLKIYVDRIPDGIRVNRMLPIIKEGPRLNYGLLSENCTSFTEGNDNSKWQNIEFLCDTSNTIDNKIGTSSSDGINVVELEGPSGTSHRFFFLYIDRNVRPNYSILYNAITSFRVK